MSMQGIRGYHFVVWHNNSKGKENYLPIKDKVRLSDLKLQILAWLDLTVDQGSEYIFAIHSPQ